MSALLLVFFLISKVGTEPAVMLDPTAAVDALTGEDCLLGKSLRFCCKVGSIKKKKYISYK
jgi:hypothetical protein